MIRKSLYLAASAVALLAAAQGAQAGSISGTGVFSGVSSADASGAFKLAQELTYSTAYSSATAAAATQATATFNLLPTNSFTTGESLLLTVDVSAGGIFAGTSFSATGTGTCAVQSVAAVNPVAVNATSAQYLVNLTGTCTGAGNGISIAAPIQVTGADMVMGAQLQQSFGGQLINVDGGKVSAKFVDVTRAFSATVSASGTDATAQVTNGYRTLNFQPTLGTVVVSASSSVNKALSTASGSAVSSDDIEGVALTVTAVTGSFTGINVANNAANFTSGTSSATVSTVRVASGVVGANAITIVDNTSTATTAGINADGIIPASTFTVSAAVDLIDGLADFTASGALSSVVRDGTSFKAPWIALGATSANSVIRLANNGTTDTGPIQMTLTSSNGAAATTPTVTISSAQVVAGALNAQGGIPAGGVVTISGAALKTAFGTAAANGDVEVTIEAQPQFISGKVRVTQATGQIMETSLGNLNGVS